VRFISSRLEFKGKVAVSAIAISFVVIIISVAVSSGFRREIRRSLSESIGDVQLSADGWSNANPQWLDKIQSMDGVESIRPVIQEAGIIKVGDNIQGVIFKAVSDTGALQVSIPDRLSKMLDIAIGDDLLCYFVDDKVKARKFTVRSIYSSPIQTESTLTVYASIQDLQRLKGWGPDQVTSLEIKLDPSISRRNDIKIKASEIASTAYLYSQDDNDPLIATTSVDKYTVIFDWLDLIDLNVYAILLLMILVAGFNMISGLLIVLFRSTSTIGTLKALGMNDRSISKVFMELSARTVGKGMLIGNAIALLFCLVQGTTRVIKLDPENYFLSFVPVHVDIPAVLVADLAAFVAILALLLIPLLFISKIDPAQSIKSE